MTDQKQKGGTQTKDNAAQNSLFANDDLQQLCEYITAIDIITGWTKYTTFIRDKKERKNAIEFYLSVGAIDEVLANRLIARHGLQGV